jgi:hypothetical protein
MRMSFSPSFSIFTATGLFEERVILKAARFRWNADLKRWETRSPANAARLSKYADGIAFGALSEHNQSLSASLVYHNHSKRFEFIFDYDNALAQVAGRAGFQFDKRCKVWYTLDPAIASRLSLYATKKCAETLGVTPADVTLDAAAQAEDQAIRDAISQAEIEAWKAINPFSYELMVEKREVEQAIADAIASGDREAEKAARKRKANYSDSRFL